MGPKEQVGLIKSLRQANRISPEQESAMLEMAALGEIKEDDIAKMVSMYSQPEEMGTAEKYGRAAVRGIAAIPGIPGDVAHLVGALKYPSISGSKPFPGKPLLDAVPGTEDVIRGIENLTGKSMQPSPEPGFGEKATETAAAGLVGGIPRMIERGAQAGFPGVLREAASNVGGSVAAQGGAEVGGLPGAIGATAGLATGKSVLKSVLRGGWAPFSEKQNAMRESVARADVMLGQSSFGTTAQGGLMRRLQSALESIPGSHGYLQEWGQRVNKTAMARLQKLVGSDPAKVSMTLEEQAGHALVSGINRRVKAIGDQSRKNYALADSLIGDKAKTIEWSNTEKVLEDASNSAMSELERRLASPAKTANQLHAADAASEQLKIFREATASGKNTYQAIDALRKSVGSKLDSADLIGDGELIGFYKKLYGALSDDLVKGAGDLGGPEAANAVRSAKIYWKAERNITEKVLQRVANRAPEWESVFRTTMNKDLTNTSKMRAMLKYSSPEEKKLVAQAWLSKLGRLPDQGGDLTDWNIGNFVKNWDRSSEAGRKMLLSGDPVFAHDIDQFVKTMKDVAGAGGLMANPSGTAAKGLAAATIYYGLVAMSGMGAGGEQGGGVGAALGTLAGAAGGAGLANGAARLMTNRTFVRWAAEAATAGPKGFPKHLARLAAIAQQSDDPVFINDLDSFSAALTSGAADAKSDTKMEEPRKLRYAQ